MSTGTGRVRAEGDHGNALLRREGVFLIGEDGLNVVLMSTFQIL